jgi:glucokinase
VSHRLAIGIDVGGTKVAGGLVAEDGSVLARGVVPTDAARGPEPVLDDVVALAGRLAREASRRGLVPEAVGLGVCELVDTEGRLASEQTLAWRDLPVRERLDRIAPAWIEADCRAAALGEARFGAGREFPTFLYLTIGTGISCTLMIEGRPWTGARGATGTIATGRHSVLCLECGAMTGSVLEELASGPALASRYAALSGRPCPGGAPFVFAAAEEGDAAALRVVDTAARSLGATLGLVVSVLDPHAVVTGGGLGSVPSLFWSTLEAAARESIWSFAQRGLPIVRASRGNEAGLVGAAIAALDRTAPAPSPPRRQNDD